MKIVHVIKNQHHVPQSKIYVKYQNLLAEIEAKQEYNSNIKEGIIKAQDKINEIIAPLQKDGHLLSRDHVIRLDELSTEIGLGKYNREWFEEYMGGELDALLDFLGHQDKLLSDLYKKYVGVTIDEIAESDDIKYTINSLNDLFGFKIDIKEFLQKGEKAYFQDHKDQIHYNFNQVESTSEKSSSTGKADKNKSTKLAEADAQLIKDARSVYMRLIKKFHPDLEQNDAIKEKKTEIVKQVTKAYQENDFFILLKLQITYLEDNETDAANIADDMLKRYNKILQKQLDEINRQLEAMRFASEDLIEDFIDKNGKFSAQKFAARKRALEKENTNFKLSLNESRKRPKGWFKEQISAIKDAVQYDMMQNMFGNMFNDTKF